MQLLSTRKDKEQFLKEILARLNIDTYEKEIYILSLEILNDSELSTFFEKILSQIMEDGKMKDEIEKMTLAPLSANII